MPVEKMLEMYKWMRAESWQSYALSPAQRCAQYIHICSNIKFLISLTLSKWFTRPELVLAACGGEGNHPAAPCCSQRPVIGNIPHVRYAISPQFGHRHRTTYQASGDHASHPLNIDVMVCFQPHGAETCSLEHSHSNEEVSTPKRFPPPTNPRAPVLFGALLCAREE